MYIIDIDCPPGYTVNEERLTQAIETVLKQHQCQTGSGVAVQIADNNTVQQLNREFRGVDTPTDVLSFPSEMPPLPDNVDELPEEWLHLGDLAIAYPYTSAQAKRLGHDLHESMALLVVHGTLHLLGYDHDTTENKAEMWQEQERALNALGVPLEIVPALEGGDE